MLFGFSAPKIRRVLTKTFSKGTFTRFFEKGPPGGGGLPDFTRRGTNYLHTTLLKTYPKSNFLDSRRTCFRFSAPKIGGVLVKTFSKGSFTRFFQKIASGGGAFYQISPDVALTTCMQLLLEMTPAICPLGPTPTAFGFSAPKIGGVFMKTF